MQWCGPLWQAALSMQHQGTPMGSAACASEALHQLAGRSLMSLHKVRQVTLWH